MCGRFVSVSSPDRLALLFDVDEVRADPLGERYNVAPTQDVYAVIDAGGERRLGTLRWGLVPFWAASPAHRPAPINARLETVLDRRMFAGAFARRRCLLPADGFYEWQRRPGRPKQPYFLHDPDGAPLAFAGIWAAWHGTDGAAGDGTGGTDGAAADGTGGTDGARRPAARERGTSSAGPRLYSCAILTAPAAGAVQAVHGRMPVVLPARLWERWLDGAGPDAPALRDELLALPAPELVLRPVSTRVNDVRNDGAELLEPETV